MKEEWRSVFKPFIGANNLCVGCGMYPEPSLEGEHWTNLDMNPDSPADVVYNLNRIETASRLRQGDGTIRGMKHESWLGPERWYEDRERLRTFFAENPWWLPFMDETFDTVLASHVLEHLEKPRLIDAVFDVARVLKPGGHFIVVVPHGTSDVGFENPHHRQLFTINTFAYFDRRLYEVPENAGTGAGQGHRYAVWSAAYTGGTPTAEWMGKPDHEIAAATVRFRNVLAELQVVLRKESM